MVYIKFDLEYTSFDNKIVALCGYQVNRYDNTQYDINCIYYQVLSRILVENVLSYGPINVTKIENSENINVDLNTLNQKLNKIFDILCQLCQKINDDNTIDDIISWSILDIIVHEDYDIKYIIKTKNGLYDHVIKNIILSNENIETYSDETHDYIICGNDNIDTTMIKLMDNDDVEIVYNSNTKALI